MLRGMSGGLHPTPRHAGVKLFQSLPSFHAQPLPQLSTRKRRYACVSKPSILNLLGPPAPVCCVETTVIKTMLPPRPFLPMPFPSVILLCSPFPSYVLSPAPMLVSLSMQLNSISEANTQGKCYADMLPDSLPHSNGISLPKRYIGCHHCTEGSGAMSSSLPTCCQPIPSQSAEYHADDDSLCKIHIST